MNENQYRLGYFVKQKDIFCLMTLFSLISLHIFAASDKSLQKPLKACWEYKQTENALISGQEQHDMSVHWGYDVDTFLSDWAHYV